MLSVTFPAPSLRVVVLKMEDTVALLLGLDAVPRPYITYIRSLPGFTGLTALSLF